MSDKNQALTLENVCKDIFEIFETEITNGNGKSVVDNYLRGKTIEEELSGKMIQTGKYSSISDIVKTEILPLYEVYKEKKEKIDMIRENRSLAGYVVGTIAVIEIIEAVLSKGRSLKPMILIPTCILEGLLGAGLYYVTKLIDDHRKKEAKIEFFKTVKRIDKKYLLEQKYDTFQEIMDGDLLQTETQSLLNKYESPESFWVDYKKIRSIDPTNEAQVKLINAPAFEEFLEMHIKGAYSNVKREKRFDELFIKAHEYFLSLDKTYVMDYTIRNGGKIK